MNAETPQHDTLRSELQRLLPGEALVDTVSRGMYATDASVYQFMPIAVVTPRGAEDIAAVLRLTREHRAPVLARGGGTSLAGQAANHAVVLDVSKHMNRVLEINADEMWVRVQPGVVRDELNARLKPLGLEFAPETATSNRANIGGMIGNNSSGARSVRYGRTLEHVLETRVMLANGEIIDCTPRTRGEIDAMMETDSEEGKLWRALVPLIEGNRVLIDERFPKVLRRVGGYSLDEFPEGRSWNLAHLICGSEGTLGVILEAKLRLLRPPENIAMLAVHYDDLIGSLHTVPAILKHDPLSVEFMDGGVLELARENASTRAACGFIEGHPAAVLFVEMDGATKAETEEKLQRLAEDLQVHGIGYAHVALKTEAECAAASDVRKKGLGISAKIPGEAKPISWIEDACVPVAHLAEYTRRVLDVVARYRLNFAIYGHASVGVLHIKPAINLKDPAHIRAMAEISHEVMEICREYGGSWSGEHGDGVARGAQNEEFWGAEMMALFRAVKSTFDPLNILNPGRIIDTPAVNANLRFGEAYRVSVPDTHFHFRDTDGFARAVEQCNGVGACRKTLGGTMCPSYMATRNEKDSTRGRANALRLAMAGHFGKDGLDDPQVHDALDLCLQCKACKTECPSNVDMARLKSEHLALHHSRHGSSLRDRLFAAAPLAAKWGSGRWAPLWNSILQSRLVRFASGRIGIASERTMPAFATTTLEKWHRKRARYVHKGRRREVVLFADCWSNFHDTAPGRWAIRALEHHGYRIAFIAGECCQRPRISRGFLADAKRDGAATVNRLAEFATRGIPILTLEPSCQSALTDDLPDLLERHDEARCVANACIAVEDFIAAEFRADVLRPPRKTQHARHYLLHGHCHQKSLFSTSPTKLLLDGDGADRVEEIDSGCCGMAGSFGYEADHFDVSMQIGERRLFPAIREQNEETLIVTNGFSCRHQIYDATGRRAMHAIEAYAREMLGLWHRK